MRGEPEPLKIGAITITAEVVQGVLGLVEDPSLSVSHHYFSSLLTALSLISSGVWIHLAEKPK